MSSARSIDRTPQSIGAPTDHAGRPYRLPKTRQALEDAIYNQLRPRTVIEELLVADIADHAWTLGILRAVMVNVLEAVDASEPEDTEASASATRPSYSEIIQRKLTPRAQSNAAGALLSQLDDLEQLQRLIAGAESLRNKALRELTRLREIDRQRRPVVDDAPELVD